MTPTGIALERLANQHLTHAPFESPAAVVGALGAVQAQDYSGAKWALALRMHKATDVTLDAAFNAGEILRTHVLRPTWHFVTPEDIRWLLELTAPRVHAFNAFMYRKLEVDDAVFKTARGVLTKELEGGKHKTRTELAKAMEKARISTKDGVRLSLIMMRAELDGLICSGARKGKQFTYALLEERAPQAKAPKRQEALYELTRRYFTTRGPATAQDFAWWSGLTVTEIKKGLAECKPLFESEQIGSQTYYFAEPNAPRPKSPTAQLLPNYDEYFIGYKDRRAIGERVRAHTAEELNRALFLHILFVNGEIVGGWRRTLGKKAVLVESHLLTALSRGEERAIAAAVENYGAFLELPVEFRQEIFNTTRNVGLFT